MLNKFIINSQWILSIIFIIYDYYCTLYQMSYLKLSLLILKCFKVKSEIHKFLALSTLKIRSDQISRSVVSDSLRPHESQHARTPCPSPTPGVHWDSRPSSQWCHPAISSSVVPFSSCPQSLPASESFPMSQLLITLFTENYIFYNSHTTNIIF